MGLVLYLALGVMQDGKHGPENCHITGWGGLINNVWNNA